MSEVDSFRIWLMSQADRDDVVFWVTLVLGFIAGVLS